VVRQSLCQKASGLQDIEHPYTKQRPVSAITSIVFMSMRLCSIVTKCSILRVRISFNFVSSACPVQTSKRVESLLMLDLGGYTRLFGLINFISVEYA
jgi:hypothetical protein